MVRIAVCPIAYFQVTNVRGRYYVISMSLKKMVHKTVKFFFKKKYGHLPRYLFAWGNAFTYWIEKEGTLVR